MVPPPSAPRRRVRVSAVALLVVLAGAFVWGLGMFALGRGNPDPTPVTVRDAAQEALNGIDLALAKRDWHGADTLIAAARLPAGASWEAALRLRREQLAAGRTAPVHKEFLTLSPHATRSGDWLAVAKEGDRHLLLRSTDAGAHWQEAQRLAGPATVLRTGDRVLVATRDNERLGWTSADGGATWQSLAWPTAPGVDTAQARLATTGDGRVLVALPGTAHQELHLHGVDGIWSLVVSGVEIRAMASLEREALVLAAMPDDAHTLRLSTDSGRTFTDAPAALQPYGNLTVERTESGEDLRLVFSDGRQARFARTDGAFIACDP